MCRQDTKSVPTALTGALGSKKHKLQQQMKTALNYYSLNYGVPEWCVFVSVCLFLLSFVSFYFYIQHERGCRDLIILPLPAHRCALFNIDRAPDRGNPFEFRF